MEAHSGCLPVLFMVVFLQLLLSRFFRFRLWVLKHQAGNVNLFQVRFEFSGAVKAFDLSDFIMFNIVKDFYIKGADLVQQNPKAFFCSVIDQYTIINECINFIQHIKFVEPV